MIFIFTTINKKSTVVKIGRALLKERLIACYNLFPVELAYWWKGKIENDKEILMILKTKAANFKKIETYIQKHSGYEVPEVLSVKPEQISKPYLDWLNQYTK